MGSPAAFAGPTPNDSEIRKILDERIAALTSGKGGVGIIAGLLDANGARYVAAGQRDRNDARALSGSDPCEIGSMGKGFAGLVLADMVVHGEVALGDPAGKYLPHSAKIPERNGRAITLFDLATHMSGLPFMPPIPSSPAPNYSASDLYAFLASYALTRDPGSDWEYSNLGYWLLSEALSARSGTPYPALLERRVLVPLGMTRSGIRLASDMEPKPVIGHDASLNPAIPLSAAPVYNLMPAAGAGFYATADDLVRFLSAALRFRHVSIAKAIALSVAAHRPIPGSENLQALGWTLYGGEHAPLVFRDGGTFGFSSCIAWDERSKKGAVVLANCVGDIGDIGRHLLRPEYPIVAPSVAPIHTEIALTAEALKKLVGRYEVEGEGVFAVSFDSDHLNFDAPSDWGLPRLRIRPESSTNFFVSEVPLRVTFQVLADGSVATMTIYPPRRQKGLVARRIG